MPYKSVNSATVMVVGPLLDDIDFSTPETAIAWNAGGLSLSLIQECTDGTTVVTALAPAALTWLHLGLGYYSMAVTAAQNNEEGNAYIIGACTGVLPFASLAYDIISANMYTTFMSGVMALTVSGMAAFAGVTAGDITVIRGDTAVISLLNIGALTNRSKLYFTVKKDAGQIDTESTLKAEKTAGLQIILGATATTPGNVTITEDDVPTGDITITIAAAETVKLNPGNYIYDVKIVRSAGVPVSTLTAGSFIVADFATDAIT